MTGHRSIRRPIWAALAAASLLLVSPAGADCAKTVRGEVYCGAGHCEIDRFGKVWCSRFDRGGAAKTREGAVLCGRGACEKDSAGRIFCSTEVAGSVTRDSQGRVRCYGGCEPARRDLCESTPAAVAETSDDG